MKRIHLKMTMTGLAAVAVIGLSANVHAASINVFNTGVDANGAVVANGTVGDQHYTLLSAPSFQSTTIKVANAANGYPIGPWYGDNSLSQWIGPNDPILSGAVGDYVYRTTFDLSGLDQTSASLKFRWATDDVGSNVVINGVSTGLSAPWANFSGWQTINSNFVAGINTLDFKVNNSGGPTGLRVEFDHQLSQATAVVSSVPEPETLAMMMMGLAMMGVVRRRRL